MNRFTDAEIQLLQNISYSLVEEVDIFYAVHKNPEFQNLTPSSLKERIIHSVEVLENMREGTEQYSRALQQLYAMTMGKCKIEGVESVTERRMIACQTLNNVAQISFLCHNLNSKLTHLPIVSASTENDAHLV